MGEFGIPTTYNCVRFRSRLEARWAVMFDALRWPWLYEPTDLHAYIPDFVLQLNDPILVEVKPATGHESLIAFTRKLDASGWLGEALLVGATVWDTDHAHPVIGLFREELEWSEARLVTCMSCGHVTPLPADMSWRCRVCGIDLQRGDLGEAERTVGLWVDAGNRVQWRPARENLCHRPKGTTPAATEPFCGNGQEV